MCVCVCVCVCVCASSFLCWDEGGQGLVIFDINSGMKRGKEGSVLLRVEAFVIRSVERVGHGGRSLPLSFCLRRKKREKEEQDYVT